MSKSISTLWLLVLVEENINRKHMYYKWILLKIFSCKNLQTMMVNSKKKNDLNWSSRLNAMKFCRHDMQIYLICRWSEMFFISNHSWLYYDFYNLAIWQFLIVLCNDKERWLHLMSRKFWVERYTSRANNFSGPTLLLWEIEGVSSANCSIKSNVEMSIIFAYITWQLAL